MDGDLVLVHDKYCSRCKRRRPVADFGRSRSRLDGLQTYCRSCFSEYDRERKKKNPRRVSHEQHREKCLRSKYGITTEDYSRLFAEQSGVCAICGGTESGNPYGVLEVEHDHDTGTVRGLVCHPCNNAIMWYEQWLTNPHRKQVIAYLKRAAPRSVRQRKYTKVRSTGPVYRRVRHKNQRHTASTGMPSLRRIRLFAGVDAPAESANVYTRFGIITAGNCVKRKRRHYTFPADPLLRQPATGAARVPPVLAAPPVRT